MRLNIAHKCIALFRHILRTLSLPYGPLSLVYDERISISMPRISGARIRYTFTHNFASLNNLCKCAAESPSSYRMSARASRCASNMYVQPADRLSISITTFYGILNPPNSSSFCYIRTELPLNSNRNHTIGFSLFVGQASLSLSLSLSKQRAAKCVWSTSKYFKKRLIVKSVCVSKRVDGCALASICACRIRLSQAAPRTKTSRRDSYRATNNLKQIDFLRINECKHAPPVLYLELDCILPRITTCVCFRIHQSGY